MSGWRKRQIAEMNPMKTIYKFPIEMSEDFEVEFDHMGVVVKAERIMGVPQMWVQVNTENSERKHRFAVHGTGHPIADNEMYIDTFFDGPYVWHLFKVCQ